ncbi:MAG: DUF2892 domain-containing protein [Syntrophothermus sp.]
MKREIHRMPSATETNSQESTTAAKDPNKQKVKSSIAKYKTMSKEAIDDRLHVLDGEWNTERILEASLAAIILTSGVLAFTLHRNWLAMAGVAVGFMVQHSIAGWALPVPLYRKLGVRTIDEINKEKNALKKIRGTKQH